MKSPRHTVDIFPNEISVEVAEKGLEISRLAMEQQVKSGEKPAPKASKCPFAGITLEQSKSSSTIEWKHGSKALLDNVPEGYCRDMTLNAMETIATKMGLPSIDKEFIKSTLETFQKGSAKVVETLGWQQTARDSIANAPDMVRGMLVHEIETWAKQNDKTEITLEIVEVIKVKWSQSKQFHLNPEDPGNND